ncbi:MAG TPA: fimbria/pilus outer membrane usher protein [Luteibacter sp.]|uniref:fimbria/pilus outer membrane usher protein n=1 Tax=Luteibacter sp. TaxID=1886636 RepID=UPI002B92A0D6|nr:fimbria/pilus outer membrane usher protein [Luteibacter sp.]HVI56830.1 fimbria/pilus outer membrane usher protein [Luteibacter sp.]
MSGAHLRLALLPLAYATDITDAYAMRPDENLVRDGDVEFDQSMLKLRGIDPKLAEYFREAPRFTAGHHVVSLAVNGKPMGQTSARFNPKGALCIDQALLDAAELTPIRTNDPATGESQEASCVNLVAVYPTAKVEIDPGKAAVSLLVPTDALRVPTQDVSGYEHGGAAGLLNYEITGLDSRWGSRTSRYWSANTEAGFNAGDWVFRSHQVSTSSDGRHRIQMLDTYAQRAFPERRSVLQVGEINLVSPVLSGAQIAGAQVMSEQALPTQGGGAIVEGVAQGEARVEVRQDGVLVYSTIVPAGPFKLADIPRINRYADLDVTVVGIDGGSQHFVVAAALAGTIAPSAGYSFAVGKVRNTGADRAPWVASGGWSGPVGRGVSLSGGLMAASNYRAIGLGLGVQVGSTMQLQVNLAGSDAPRVDASGTQAMLALSQRLTDRWSFGLSHTRQDRGYRDLLDTTRVTQASLGRSRYRDQSTATLSWSHPGLGNLSTGYSRTILFDGRGARRALASWGTRVGRASLSLSAEWNLNGGRRARDNSVFLTVSVPLGEQRRLTTSMRRYGAETRYGANLSEQINEYASYRAGMEYRPGDRRRSLTAGLSLLPRYLQLDTGYTRNPEGSTTTLGLRGALVLHTHGLTASPYAVRDTFGVLSVGDAAGVRVSTPGGPVWTDARGYAVLPQLSPFGKSSIEVATDSLPRHVDIQNGAAIVEAGRGAVASLRFGVVKTRRLLLTARSVDGRALPVGATVTDEHGELVSLVQGDGQVFVPNALATPRLWVNIPDLPRCELDYALGATADAGAYFESAVAVCHAVERSGP